MADIKASICFCGVGLINNLSCPFTMHLRVQHHGVHVPIATIDQSILVDDDEWNAEYHFTSLMIQLRKRLDNFYCQTIPAPDDHRATGITSRS